ncbi:ligand-binding sensor domain-containing protein [Lunatimonas lonarensis]|uniref:ligand-binding sensor domain-containing protein n=1 Tax=Lunatimonas lonarensis TaxID=1232681 RepID=UPI0009DBB067|nr:triple tyrosine motif-containing protein [Lunatimonas lonarensis]
MSKHLNPKLKVLLILLYSLVHGTLAIGQTLGLPFSRYYPSQEYRGGIQNYAITQSPDGLVYVANNFGLLEYDGIAWRRNTLPNGSKVRHVQLSESGLIYVAGQGDFGYFGPNETGRFAFYSLKEKLPEAYRNLEEVWHVFLSTDALLFCTDRQIFVFDATQTFRHVISTKSVFESFHVHGNRLFANEVGTGLHYYQRGELLPLLGGAFFEDKRIASVIQISEDSRLVFTRSEGVFHMEGESIRPWNGALSSTVNTALQLENGHIAVGTQTEGLYIVTDRGETVLHLDNGHGLNNNVVLSLREDLSGNLWVGHSNGITLVELSNPFRKINRFSGLTGTGYHATLFEGRIYFGTNNGVYVQDSPDRPSGDAVLVENSSGQVYQLKSIQGRLLVAHNDGAFWIRGNRAKRLEGPSGIWCFQPLAGHPNLLLVGGYKGLYLFEILPDDIRFLRQLSGFDESSRVIEQDESGYIWVTHGYKGVYRLRVDEKLERVSVEEFGPETGLPTPTLNNVWRVGNRLVFTTQAGVFRFLEDKKQFERDSFFLDFFGPGVLIHYLQEDPQGNVHFIAEDQVGVLEKRMDGSFLKHHEVFNQLIPLLNDDLQNIAALRRNEVLFAANEGFVHFRMSDHRYRPYPYATLIRGVYLTGVVDSLIYGGNLRMTGAGHSSIPPKIPYAKANIRFESSNPTPNNENELEFRYWLEGLEPGYGEWGKRSDRAYTNLREGRYTFHVSSRNQFGEEAAEAVYSFEVLAPWYRSPLAYGVYLVVFCVLMVAGYRVVEKRYQKKAQRLKQASRRVIEEKESVLKTTREEVEKLRTEKLRQEIQLKDKELATATMHLITKNGFIDNVKGNLTGIIKKSKNQEVKNEIQKLIKHIEKNIAEDEDWEQFEIHFDQVHGDFMSRFKKSYPELSPQEIKLSAYLRMNLSTKEIAYLMNISVRGVEIARYRLRKKLTLQREDNLQEYILKF